MTTNQVLTQDQVNQYHHLGFVVVQGLLADTLLKGAQDNMTADHPSAVHYFADPDKFPLYSRTQFSLKRFPFNAHEVNRLLKRERGNARLNVEGYRTEGNWLLTDYGDVVVHVFTAQGRELYDLEQLWADAQRVEWNNEE